ncbi:unnamed protein product [Ilex paraguariensis]|uniref:Uncharacterized protein n=1 Tax=Ilex paraguariensis TaxID=185542 RepID=A0ABC8QXG4_9AQUA
MDMKLMLLNLLMEVNVLAKNPSRIWLDMGDEGARWQKIIYEKAKKFCKFCQKQDHGEDECIKRKVPDLQAAEEVQNTEMQGFPRDKGMNDDGVFQCDIIL